MADSARTGGAFQTDALYTMTGGGGLVGATLTSPTITGATSKRAVISGSGATVTLTAAQSGSLALFDRAAGIVYTLPAPAIGLWFEFAVITTITTGSATMITDAATTFVTGTVVSATEATTPSATAGPKNFSGDGSTHIKVAMNGTTTGGIIGSYWTAYCVTATKWFVTGVVEASGTIATPFST